MEYECKNQDFAFVILSIPLEKSKATEKQVTEKNG